MGFTINFNVGVVQKVVQFQSGSDKDGGDQGKKKDNKPAVADNGEEKKNKENKTVSMAEDNGEGKKEEKKAVSTVVFTVHCGSCIRKVCEVLAKTKGIRDMLIDVENNHVTVKGEMDMKALLKYLKRKLKKAVVIFQVNEIGAGEEEKEGKENGTYQYGFCPHGCPHPEGYPNLRPNGYGSGYLAAAEQMFSDENPNACSVM